MSDYIREPAAAAATAADSASAQSGLSEDVITRQLLRNTLIGFTCQFSSFFSLSVFRRYLGGGGIGRIASNEVIVQPIKT